MRRLNRDEYNRTIQQVFGMPALFPADDFPPDDAIDGFTNVGEGLNLSAVLVEQYLKAGDVIARLALNDGPKPASLTRAYTTDSKTPATTIQGTSNSHSFRKNEGIWTSGELSVKVAQAPPGFYKVRLTATAHLADRPDYIPNFRYQANDRLVFQADSPIRDGKLAQEFVFAHTQGNFAQLDFNWVNGFSTSGQGRAQEFRQSGWDDKQAYTRKTVGNFVNQAKKDNPDSPLPVPHFTEVKIEVEGPLYPDGWPLSRFQRENADALAKKDAKAIAEWLLPRLFRRPAKAEEIKDFVAFVAKSEAGLADAKPLPIPVAQRFPAAIRLAVQRSLVSPNFLFLVEPGSVGRKLTDHELAVRLSYFLWSASPDDELTKLANEGKLRPNLAAQAKRMLADPRAKVFVDRFTTEWLGLDKLSSIMPEPALYPRFDAQNHLRRIMADEPKALMTHLLKENGSLYDLLDSDYAMLNDRLADHHHLPSLWTLFPVKRDGFAPVSGGDFRKVKLPEGQRGGLVTTSAFLAMTSENSRTSPVKRGVWVLEKLFNRTPPPPPPNVNGVLPDTTDGTTAAEKLKLHRNAANCAGCHARIDPFGLALENFDVIGEWRDREPPHIDPANPSSNEAAVRAKLKLKKYDPLPTYPIDVTFRMGDFEAQGPNGAEEVPRRQQGQIRSRLQRKIANICSGSPPPDHRRTRIGPPPRDGDEGSVPVPDADSGAGRKSVVPETITRVILTMRLTLNIPARIVLAWSSLLTLSLGLGGCAPPLTQKEKIERELATPVKGFVDEKDLGQATFRITRVEYFGGFTNHVEFAKGKATLTNGKALGNEKNAKPAPRVHTLSADEKAALNDVLNLIVRDKLWTQPDAKTEGVRDGGEVLYEFSVGGHEGKFKLINSSPAHLHVFQTKAANLMNQIEASLSGTVPKR
jgi:3-methyladenine DNA glycosylase AlkC